MALRYEILVRFFIGRPHKIGEITYGNVDGLFQSDALLNLGGVVVLGAVFWKLGSFGKTKHPPEQLPG